MPKMKFRFRAEILLKLRKRREEAARERFSQAVGDVETTIARLRRLHLAQRMHNRAIHETLAGGADAMNLRLYRQCIGEIRRAIDEDNEHLADARRTLQRSRTDLLEAMKERKLLGAVRDRQADRHASDRRRGDEKESEEIHAAHRAMKHSPDDRLAGRTAG